MSLTIAGWLRAGRPFKLRTGVAIDGALLKIPEAAPRSSPPDSLNAMHSHHGTSKSEEPEREAGSGGFGLHLAIKAQCRTKPEVGSESRSGWVVRGAPNRDVGPLYRLRLSPKFKNGSAGSGSGLLGPLTRL